jgi:hypothetical protein
MKTSHFEGGIALGATKQAQGRAESTQREPATFDFDFGRAWLVPPAHCAGAGDPPRDGRPASALGGFKTGQCARRLGVLIGAKSGHSALRVCGGCAA